MKYAPLLCLLLLLPLSATAASLSLTPSAVSTAPGRSFTLDIVANPSNATSSLLATITSIRAHVAFDPRIVQETSFSFAPGWLALPEPGYDTIDNADGTAIKTAGYPGGITRSTPFGSMTFRVIAPAAGKTLVVIAGDTEMLDGESVNQFAGSANGALIQVAAQPLAAVRTSAQDHVPSGNMPLTTATPRPDVVLATSSLVAAVGSAAASLMVPWWLALVCLVLGLGAGYALRRH